MTETEAEEMRRRGNAVMEDAGRGWRRCVASPLPKAIVEIETVRALMDAGQVVVACGGGGIPVTRDKYGDLHGVSAVMRGAGRARMPMFTMLACWCILRVTYITLAVKAFPVIETIFWAYPITWCTSCVVFLIYYLKADWVHTFDRGV